MQYSSTMKMATSSASRMAPLLDTGFLKGGAGPFSGRRDGPFLSSGFRNFTNLTPGFREKITSRFEIFNFYVRDFEIFACREANFPKKKIIKQNIYLHLKRKIKSSVKPTSVCQSPEFRIIQQHMKYKFKYRPFEYNMLFKKVETITVSSVLRCYDDLISY